MYPGSEQAAHVHFHYDVIKAQYGSNARLLFTDTDSLCYHIRCLDFYKDMLADKDNYDLSNYPKETEFYDPTNKAVIGKFKDDGITFMTSWT